MLPGQGSAATFPFPTQTSSARLLQQEIGSKFPCRPCRHWPFSHGYKILHRSKGQHENIIDYLHEGVLKSFSKENETQILFHVPTAEISAAVNWMPALNQLSRKPEGQEGVRFRNSGQAGRKHQEETPAAAVEAKKGAEALRQIITGRVAAVADVRLWFSGGGWDNNCEEKGFFLKLICINYLKRDSSPKSFETLLFWISL